MDTNDQCHSVDMEVRIRRTFLIKLGCQIGEWFYPMAVWPDSIPDKLVRLGCRIAKAEYRFDDGPWQNMGTVTHRFINTGFETQVEVHIRSPKED